MGRRFAYFYFMKNEPDKVREVVPLHIEYWKNRELQNYQGGPFADRTGGLIIFETSDIDTATDIVMKDPFIIQNIINQKWIYEWLPECTSDS